jgi:hypothetical protein
MRHLLAVAAMAGMVVVAVPPAEAKSIWLTCGSQVINLDSAKERYSINAFGRIYQGPAIFSPRQIDFEYISSIPGAFVGHKIAWMIDKKSLNCTQTGLSRSFNTSYGVADTGWKILTYPGNTQTGKCSIMKTPPTAGNQI